MLEAVARQMDGSERCYAEYPIDRWLPFLSEKREKNFRKFAEYCQNYGKIFVEYNGKICKITCPKLLELRDEYSRKSGHAPDMTPDKVAPDTDTEVDKERKRPTNPIPIAATPPVDLKKELFDSAVKTITRTGGSAENARGFIGKMLRDHEMGDVLKAVIAADKQSAVEPKAYIQGFLRETKQSFGNKAQNRMPSAAGG